MKQSRNQYTGAAGITQREAAQINRSIRNLQKIMNKDNLYVRHEIRLEKAIRQLIDLLLEAER
jgi:hypothetical protein